MPTFTDYHARIRDKIVLALAELNLGVEVKPIDDLADRNLLDTPVVAVACVAPEQRRDEMSTNRRSGIGYGVAVAYFTLGTPNGEQSPGPDQTLFRRAVEQTFHMKRLDGVDEVGWCEVYPDGIVYDRDEPAFQSLNTMLTVVAVGRFTR